MRAFLLLILCTYLYSTNLQKVTLQLNWKYQFEFAGFIAAKEKGFYKNSGLDVDILEYTNKTNIINDIKNNKYTFGLYSASLLDLYDPNKPIVLLANYLKRSALVFITKQNILVPEDLKGKRVMYLNEELNDSSLATLLKLHKIKKSDFISKKHNFSPKEFINGSVDAMTGYISNELYQIIKSNTPYNIIDPQNYFDTQGGMNLFSSLKQVNQNPKMVSDFLEATKHGWKYALENKEEIINIIYNKYSKLKSKDALRFEANKIEKLMMPNIYEIGKVLKKDINDKLEMLKSKNKIQKQVSYDNILFKNRINKKFSLNEKEKKYLLKKKTITMCIDPFWMPFEKLKNGKHIGITSDYIDILSKKLNIPFKLIPAKTWEKSLNLAKNRQCDILSLAATTKSRLEYMNFTSPYISFPIVIVTKSDKFFIANIEDTIQNKKIGMVKGFFVSEIMKRKYPKNKIIDVNNIDEGMKKVAKGELFGMVEALPSAAYLLQHKYVGELKISGRLNNEANLSIAVRNDDINLLHILEKTLNSIKEETKQEILNKYISIKIEEPYNYKILYSISFIIFFVFILFLYRNRQLEKYNRILNEQKYELDESNTKLKLIKTKLEKANEESKKLIDSVLSGILIFENKVCIEANMVAVELLGYDLKSELIGKKLEELTPKEEFQKVFLNFEQTSRFPYESQILKKNNEVFDVLIQGTNSKLYDKNVRIFSFIDITEIKNNEKILFQQTKMAAMGEMLENIAHQWRQPLSSISSLATGLELKKQINNVSLEDEFLDLKKINKSAQYLSQTIEDFRDFFKNDKIKIKFSIYEAIKNNLFILDSIVKNNNIVVVFRVKDDVSIISYKNEFMQAIMNILNNAIDAMKDKKEDKYIIIDIKKLEHSVCISIADNGGGIKDEHIDNIFEPYFTTKHKAQGTGIGLYMTHQIVENHIKGTITVKNVKNEFDGKLLYGASFNIEISLIKQNIFN